MGRALAFLQGQFFAESFSHDLWCGRYSCEVLVISACLLLLLLYNNVHDDQRSIERSTSSVTTSVPR